MTDPAPAPIARVDDRGMYLPATCTVALDVLLDNARVWSFLPSRDGHKTGEQTFVAWPQALRPLLHGQTTVSVKESRTARVVLSCTVRFDDSSQRVVVASADGHPLMIDKSGHLVPALGGLSPEALKRLLRETQRLLRTINDRAGLPAWLAYGALLGAVREGHLLEHDSDIDISYLSRAEHPMDVALESYRLERTLRQHGWSTFRMSADDFKVFVHPPGVPRIGVDVFGSFHLGSKYFVMPRVSGSLARCAILPTASVSLNGVDLPVPHDPEAMLNLCYGESWRDPDPAWRPLASKTVTRQLNGWMRGLQWKRSEWDGRLKSAESLTAPSEFAKQVAARIPPEALVIDIGCGLGSDGVWFAGQGHRVVGLDYSPNAVHRARARARDHRCTAAFRLLNLYDFRSVVSTGARLARRSRRPRVVYSREVVGALTTRGRMNFWLLARMLLQGQGGYAHIAVQRPAPLASLLAEAASRGGRFQWCHPVPGTGSPTENRQHYLGLKWERPT